MRAFLINPFAKEISQIDLDLKSYKEIARAIGAEFFDAITINKHRDHVYLDDTGLISDKPKALFRLTHYPTVLANKALVLGCDEMGESQEPVITLEDLRAAVTWETVGAVPASTISYYQDGKLVTEELAPGFTVKSDG